MGDKAGELRQQILELTAQYHAAKFPVREFVPGTSTVPVSGKVIDAADISSVVDSALDGWFTTGRWAKVGAEGSVQVTVKVRNTGKRAGDEVVQLYVQHLGSKVERPKLELKGFRRVRIEAGAEWDVTLDLKPRDLAYWDAGAHVWRVEKEPVRVLAGGSSDSLPVQATLEVDTGGEFKP